jgi:hypothetical protein
MAPHSAQPTWPAIAAICAIEACSLAVAAALASPLKDHPALLAALLASHAAPLLLLIACQLAWRGELRPARAAALLNATIVAPLLLHEAASDQLLPVLHSAACLATSLPAALALLVARGRAADPRPALWPALVADLAATALYMGWLGYDLSQLPKSIVGWSALKLLSLPLASAAMTAPKDARLDSREVALAVLGTLLIGVYGNVIVQPPASVYVPLVGVAMGGAIILQATAVLCRKR